MRFEVPQFIEIEDKIVGPLTWRQFVYLAGGTGILVFIYLKFSIIVFVFLGLPLGILAFSLAFHRINNRPFSVFLESFVNYMMRKKLYLWKKDRVQIITAMPEKPAQIPKDISGVGQKSISSLLHQLENHVPK